MRQAMMSSARLTALLWALMGTSALAQGLDPRSVCHSYCDIYGPKEPDADVNGVYRVYQAPDGVWAGMDILIRNDDMLAPGTPIVTHVHAGPCHYPAGEKPPKLLLAPDLILQVNAEPDPENHRYRQASFEGALPPIGSDQVQSHVIHHPDGSSHACCTLTPCAPPEGSSCLGYADVWDVLDVSIAESVKGHVIVSTYDGGTRVFQDIELRGTPVVERDPRKSECTQELGVDISSEDNPQIVLDEFSGTTLEDCLDECKYNPQCTNALYVPTPEVSETGSCSLKKIAPSYDLTPVKIATSYATYITCSQPGQTSAANTRDYESDALLKSTLEIAIVNRESLQVLDNIKGSIASSGVGTRIGEHNFAAQLPLSLEPYAILLRTIDGKPVASAPLGTCPDFIPVQYESGEGDGSGDDHDDGPSVALIAGGAAAAFAIILALVVLAVMLVRKRKRRSADAKAMPTALTQPPYNAHSSLGAKVGMVKASNTLTSNQLSEQYRASFDYMSPHAAAPAPGLYHDPSGLRSERASGLRSERASGVRSEHTRSSAGTPDSTRQPRVSISTASAAAVAAGKFKTGSREGRFSQSQWSYMDWTETVQMQTFTTNTHTSSKNGSRAGTLSTCGSFATENKDLLEALQSMQRSRALFMGRYLVKNPRNTHYAAPTVIWSMTDIATDQETICKFFKARSIFDREASLYARGDLRTAIPALQRIEPNLNSEVRAANGYVVPPFMILERGQPLDEWVARRHPDVSQTISMLTQLADKLAQLHTLGIAHRDLKPANVMWRSAANEWTLTDYACAGSIGNMVAVSFTLCYAAPEVVQAYVNKEPEVLVTSKHDMYSLGVIAFEILTKRQSVWSVSDRPEDITDQIIGKAPAPWESGHPACEELIKLMRISSPIKSLLLSLLSRNPDLRPSASMLSQALKRIYSESGSGLQ